MATTALTLHHIERLRSDLSAVLDRSTRELTTAWAAGFEQVEGDLTDALTQLAGTGVRKVTRAQMLSSARLARALRFMSEELATLADSAGISITGRLRDVVSVSEDWQKTIWASQLPHNRQGVYLQDQWSEIDEGAVRSIIRRSTDHITSRLDPVSADTMTVIRSELVRGVTVGSSPRATARRMVARVEKQWNGHLSLQRALTISRTEQLDAHRQASAAEQLNNAEILAGWEWGAKLDGRTCASCWGQAGRVFGLSEAGPLDHPQGRCVRIPRSKTWRELGIDLPETPSSAPDPAEVFGRLPSSGQRAILGSRGYEAWIEGRFPMHTWSKRRKASGWRDSFVPALAPQAGQSLRRKAS